MSEDNSNQPSRKSGTNWGIGMAIGLEFFGLSVVGSGIGVFVDERFGSSPWGALLGGFFGLGIALVHALKIMGRD